MPFKYDKLILPCIATRFKLFFTALYMETIYELCDTISSVSVESGFFILPQNPEFKLVVSDDMITEQRGSIQTTMTHRV